MQRVIFNQLSPLHPLFMLHRAIATTLLPPSHFIFIFILSLVTGGGDNRCKAKLWVAYPPFLLLYFCSLQQKDCPLIFPSLLPLVFLLLCLSESLSLSFLWPFISPPTPPLALSWYFSWLLREGFLLEASSCWQRRGRFTVGSRRSRRCTTPWDSLMWNGGILNSFNALFGDYLLRTSSSHLTLGYNRQVQKKSNVCTEAFCMFDV